MTRDEAIEYIKAWLPDEYALNGSDRIVLEMAIEALSEPKTGWIPVSEKLPKEGQKIIFTEHDHYAKQRGDGLPEEIVGVGTYFLYKEWNYSLTEHMAKKAEKEGFGKDHVIVYGRRYNDEESEITAWMPLPEPYKGGDEE